MSLEKFRKELLTAPLPTIGRVFEKLGKMKIFYPNPKPEFSYKLEGLFLPLFNPIKLYIDVGSGRESLVKTLDILRMEGHELPPDNWCGYVFCVTEHPYHEERKILHVFDITFYGCFRTPEKTETLKKFAAQLKREKSGLMKTEFSTISWQTSDRFSIVFLRNYLQTGFAGDRKIDGEWGWGYALTANIPLTYKDRSTRELLAEFIASSLYI